MYDQAYSKKNFKRLLERGDFRGVSGADIDDFRESVTSNSVEIADRLFASVCPVRRFHLKKKSAYGPSSLENDLIIRKATRNLRQVLDIRSASRNLIVQNIIRLLSEGVPYRVYRLDIRRFYPSIDHQGLLDKIEHLSGISPQSKAIIKNLLSHYWASGGTGVPIGLQISSPLADLYLKDFDAKASGHSGIYFYERYVDDIIVIGSPDLEEDHYLNELRKYLPAGLLMHSGKKKYVGTLKKKCSPDKAHRKKVLSFSYLGYDFSVFEPKKNKGNEKNPYREVDVEMSEDKRKRYKFKLSRSLIDFERTSDFTLLLDRIKFLTKNFSITDKRSGRRRMAGIYYGYPVIGIRSSSLADLDGYLRMAVMRGVGGARGVRSSLSGPQIRMVLAHSFVRGHEHKEIVGFSTRRIYEIQECWSNE